MSVELVGFGEEHLTGVLRLYEAEGWPSLAQDPPLARRALTAPGVVSLVAVENDVVAEPARRHGVGRALVEEAYARSGARRLDLLAGEGSEAFYRSFRHRTFPGYRIYPDAS